MKKKSMPASKPAAKPISMPVSMPQNKPVKKPPSKRCSYENTPAGALLDTPQTTLARLSQSL